ncbi:MAG TPA: transporter associated domain-containing protein [Steroidobacteraceae bacterium]|nr:transporter associated domain-containing protein [Steroidobacteraceae bacterium]HUA89364.1 transporter associated domain-containing protein [Steroidobacteraceae bacterium]
MAKGSTGTTGRWRARLTRTLAARLADRSQLIEMLDEAQQRGLLDADAFAMLEGVLEVAELQVRDIMVPRAQMLCLRREEPIARILAAVVDSGHSRYPVLADDRDDVVGVLLAKDLLRLYATGMPAEFEMREYLRPATFVPESKRLNVLLKEFRLNRNHMAIVIDEYGGVAGLVTIEDVIEQIVGDIDDEFDVEDDQDIRREAERQFSVRGSTRIGDFNRYFNVELPEEEFDTIAGLVMKQFGRMPRRGESVSLGELEFRVTRADRRRIDTLRVTIPAKVHPVASLE